MNIALQVLVALAVADVGLEELLLAQRISNSLAHVRSFNGGCSQFGRKVSWFHVGWEKPA